MKKTGISVLLAVTVALCLVLTSCPAPNGPSGSDGSFPTKDVKDFFVDYGNSGWSTDFYASSADEEVSIDCEKYTVKFGEETYFFKAFLGKKNTRPEKNELPYVWGKTDISFSLCKEDGSDAGKFTINVGWPDGGWYIHYGSITIGEDTYSFAD